MQQRVFGRRVEYRERAAVPQGFHAVSWRPTSWSTASDGFLPASVGGEAVVGLLLLRGGESVAAASDFSRDDICSMIHAVMDVAM